MIRIEKLTKDLYGKYEYFLSGINESLLFYSVKYKELLEDYLKVKSNYVLAIDEKNDIHAVLPLMNKKGRFGMVVNSLPFYGSNGGILARDKKSFDLLSNYYIKISNEASSSTYITNPLINNAINFEYDIIDKRISQWTLLKQDKNIEESIMLSFHSKTRNMVTKSIKENVSVCIDNSQMDFLYELHHENITSIGGKAKSKTFFKLIDKHFEKGRDYNIYIAKLNEKKIAALLLFYYNKTVEYFTPASLSEYRTYQPMSLLIYQAMIDASKKGYKLWNWGGTWLSQEGVYKFKKRFGAVDKEYFYYIKINNPDIYKSEKKILIEEYSDFYVVPFNVLEENDKG